MPETFKLFRYFFILLLLVPFVATAQLFHNDFETEKTESPWFGLNSEDDSTAFSGSRISRILASQPYSMGVELPIPQIPAQLPLQISFDARFRMAQPPQKAFYVLTLSRGDSLVYWYAIALSKFFGEANEWFRCNDSVVVPADYAQGARLKTYLWNPAGEQFDADNASIKLKTTELPSYFFTPVQEASVAGNPVVLALNRFYELQYYGESKSLVIADGKGRPLTKPLKLISEMLIRNDSISAETPIWRKGSVSSDGDSRRIILRSKNQLSSNKLIIETTFDSPNVHFELKTRYRKRGRVIRQALLLEMLEHPSRVFRKNRYVDTSDFQAEYYLQQEGFFSGHNNRLLGTYHNPGISSMQYKTKSNSLLINLDYYRDHPLIHFPLIEDSTNYFVDVSAVKSNINDKVKGSFKLLIGYEPKFTTQLMPVDSGYEAAIAWTEHADWTDLRTQRAVNFGREDIEEADSAIGGFVKFGIPVTKSIFYNNPDGVANTQISDSLFTTPHASLIEDRYFGDFIKQLHQAGHEICLHTPEQFTSTKPNLRASLSYMQSHFASPVWIDHGYDNKAISNRENLVCDGLSRHSRLKTRKLWQKHGIRYFWNPYAEDVAPYSGWNFDGQLLQPYPGFGDAFPDPVFTELPDHDDGMLWSTTGTLEVPEPRLWGYYFSNQRLQHLIHYRGIYLAHVYPAWVQPHKGFWTYDSTGLIVAQPAFNQALERIQSQYKAHKILPATVTRLLRYTEQLRTVSIDYQPDGTILLVNESSLPLHALSLITNASSVRVNGFLPHMKTVGNELIFWFDLAPAQKAVIRFD